MHEVVRGAEATTPTRQRLYLSPGTAQARTLELALLALVTRDLAINWQAGMPNSVELEKAVEVLIELGYTPGLFYDPQALDALADAYCPPRRKPRLMVVRSEDDEDDGPKAA